MQLIMDAEDTSIDIKVKMTTLDQQSLSENPITNGVQDPKNDVPNGNKENIQTLDNIIDKGTTENDKKAVDGITMSTPITEESGTEDKTENVSEKEKFEEQETTVEEVSIENAVAALHGLPVEKEATCTEKTKKAEDLPAEKETICIEEPKKAEDILAEKENTCIEEPKKSEDLPAEKENLCNDEPKNAEGLLAEPETICIQEPKKAEGIPAVKISIEDPNEAEEPKETHEPKESQINIVPEMVEASADTEVICNNEEQKTALEEVKITEEKDENVVKEVLSEITVIENAVLKDTVAEDTKIDIDLETNIEMNKKIDSVPDFKLTAQDNEKDNDVNENKSDFVADNSLDSADSRPEEVTQTEAMESLPLEAISSNEVCSSTILPSNASKNEEHTVSVQELDVTIDKLNVEKEETQSAMDCDQELPLNEDVAQTSLACEKPETLTDITKIVTNSEKAANVIDIATNSSETATKEKDDVEQPMDCDSVNDVSTDIPDCNIIGSSNLEETKNEQIIVKQSESHGLEIAKQSDVEPKSDDDDLPKIASDKKDVEADAMECDDIADVSAVEEETATDKTLIDSKSEIFDVDEIKESNEDKKEPLKTVDSFIQQEKVIQKESEEKTTPTIRLSNTLDILSDDDEEEPPKTIEKPKLSTEDKQCIDIEDDDDIMLIDDETSCKEDNNKVTNVESKPLPEDESKSDKKSINADDLIEKGNVESPTTTVKDPETSVTEVIKPEKTPEDPPEIEKPKPKLVSDDFFKTYRKNLADMTRDDLEEFCILKIVESIIDRSSLNEIRSKIKTMSHSMDEYKKKALMLSKQNRDLQVVLKSVQEEQKKVSDTGITPLKITRSVGMQVYMTEKNTRRKGILGMPSSGNIANNNQKNNNARIPGNSNPRPQKPISNQQIPVPRLVPATTVAANKTPNTTPANTPVKVSSPMPNGLKNVTPPPPKAEKRTHSRIQSVTVDLTDDEPPPKVQQRNPITPPVRLVPPQNLLAPRQQFSQSVSNSPRKVFIPISGPQSQVRPGQTIMLKSVPSSGPRQRGPAPMVRLPQNPVRMQRVQNNRHPAPLPDAMKQYQPPNWKALPPAPDLKLSKVENGIVISWKIDGYQEDSYEEIASYQLYAYQETSSPPSTALWKKIGDVKALPLPMACTLTQFMAGYKYFFAVRAVDIRSRLGPFSLPGSILLLNKM